MSDMTPNRFGLIDNTGTADALFLKVFSGEVLQAFATATVAASRHMVRTITSGKSAQFPASWKGTAAYHTPGTQILGDTQLFAERNIVIDDLLIASRAIAQIDEAKSHFDVRSIYSFGIGDALAQTYDKQVLQVIALAARAAATVTGGNGGTRIIDSAFKTTVANLEAGIFHAVQALDEKDVPANDRYVYLKPQQYYQLVSGSTKAINRDWNPNGVAGGYAAGTAFQIAGCEIVKTNNLPSTNVTTGPTAYRGNFSTVAGIVCQKGAAGTVKLIDLAMEMDYLIEYQSTLMVGKYALGHGILRPECSVELTTAATS